MPQDVLKANDQAQLKKNLGHILPLKVSHRRGWRIVSAKDVEATRLQWQQHCVSGRGANAAVSCCLASKVSPFG